MEGIELFQRRVKFPDIVARNRLNSLVGIDEHKWKVASILRVLIGPQELIQWAEKNHPKAQDMIRSICLGRPALIVLEGDVGSGKSELAENIGDDVARSLGNGKAVPVYMLSLSLSSRGSGQVGEMTQLLASAFDQVSRLARELRSKDRNPRGGVIMVIDEADAIAQSRDLDQMHHEDRAGVNALIRGIDDLARDELPAVVIMCTNRLNAIDPAIRRRAAAILHFTRPNEAQRSKIIAPFLKTVGLNDQEISKVIELTGPSKEREYGLTCSDITQRLFPDIVLDAFPDNPITAERVIQRASDTVPTPPFGGIAQ